MTPMITTTMMINVPPPAAPAETAMMGTAARLDGSCVPKPAIRIQQTTNLNIEPQNIRVS